MILPGRRRILSMETDDYFIIKGSTKGEDTSISLWEKGYL